jgi:hypothetical protein
VSKRFLHIFVLGALAISFLLRQPIAKADHLPKELLALGKAETILAGINLKTSTLKDAIRMYGKASCKQEGSGGVGCVWQFSHAKLVIGAQSESKANIEYIYIEGIDTRKLLSTGRGLRLGDDSAKLKRIYGSRYHQGESDGWDLKKRMTVAIQWASEDFSLTVQFNDQGKIISMWLNLPECYRDDCND